MPKNKTALCATPGNYENKIILSFRYIEGHQGVIKYTSPLEIIFIFKALCIIWDVIYQKLSPLSTIQKQKATCKTITAENKLKLWPLSRFSIGYKVTMKYYRGHKYIFVYNWWDDTFLLTIPTH